MSPRPAAAKLGWLVLAAVVVAVALGPPLHRTAEELFSAHMVQHLLLTTVAAPFVVLGLGHPAAVVAWAPPATRRSLIHGIRSARRVPNAGWCVVAWILHVGVLWAWHVPVLYEAALRSSALHAFEHASLLATAVPFWVAVLGWPGLRPPAAMLYLFTAAGQCTALGALLALAAVPSYEIHATTVAGWQLTPLDDQQLAGVIMWVFGGLGYLGAMLLVLGRNLRDRGRVVATLVVLIVAATACGREESAPRVVVGGDAVRGRQALERYGCGSCHEIPGVPRARGISGPTLRGLASRPYVAGSLPNDPANLAAWIRAPRSLDPRTIMPDLGVSEGEARDIATYLYAATR